MRKRLGVLGIVLITAGFAFVVAAGVAYAKVQDGYRSLQAMSEAQNVTLTYDEDGQLVDRGSTEEAVAILDLLENDWQYPVVRADLDPDDPLVNTATEYMYQMAVVGYHVMGGAQTVTLDEPVEYNGETFAAGDYEFEVDGRYWTDFDRQHPIEGPARELAWTGTVHGLFGELGVGAATHSMLQMGLALAGVLAGLGVVLIAGGGGLIWVGRAERELFPQTVPAELVAEAATAQPREVAKT